MEEGKCVMCNDKYSIYQQKNSDDKYSVSKNL